MFRQPLHLYHTSAVLCFSPHPAQINDRRTQLNAAIVERWGWSAQLQRLVLGDVALDDEDAQLSSCGVVDGTEVHAPRIVCVLMNLPTFFFVVLDATRSCARLCPSHTHANDDAPAHCVSHEAACPAA